jgi:hypothetical protein
VFVLASMACGDDGPTEPSGQSTLTARIDGVLWNGIASAGAYVDAGILRVEGGSATRIGFALPATPGIYSIGGPSGANAELAITLPGQPVAQSWVASTPGGGSITLTSITTTDVTGTFAFTLTAVGGTGASGTKVVTDGRFIVALPPD